MSSGTPPNEIIYRCEHNLNRPYSHLQVTDRERLTSLDVAMKSHIDGSIEHCLLDSEQVQILHDELGDWLERSEAKLQICLAIRDALTPLAHLVRTYGIDDIADITTDIWNKIEQDGASDE